MKGNDLMKRGVLVEGIVQSWA